MQESNLPASPIPKRLDSLVEPIKYVGSGHYHSFAVGKDAPHQLYTWGLNRKGQCGSVPPKLSRPHIPKPTVPAELQYMTIFAVSAGREHTIALMQQYRVALHRVDPTGGPIEGGTNVEVWGFAFNTVNGTFTCMSVYFPQWPLLHLCVHISVVFADDSYSICVKYGFGLWVACPLAALHVILNIEVLPNLTRCLR